jgi:metallophosphoesterase superfamily enzyme
VFLFVHTNSSVDVSEIKTRIGGHRHPSTLVDRGIRLTWTIMWVVELESEKKLLDCRGWMRILVTQVPS